jgi:hypothetical protein
MSFPNTGSNYFLVPKCAPGMSLGMTNGMPVLRPISDRNLSQQWMVVAYWADTQGGGMGLQFTSVDIGYTLARGDQEPNAPTVPSLVMESSDSSAPLLATWNLIPNGDFFAIQNTYETSLNLNVQGDGPYPADTPVLAWSWGGGAPNELWKFVDF